MGRHPAMAHGSFTKQLIIVLFNAVALLKDTHAGPLCSNASSDANNIQNTGRAQRRSGNNQYSFCTVYKGSS